MLRSLFILVFICIFCATCKKKTEEVKTIIQVDEVNNEIVYGAIYANCYSGNGEFSLLSSFKLEMSFNIQPFSPLSTYPSLTNIVSSPVDLQYFQSGWLSGNIEGSSTDIAKKFKFEFNSPQLGAFSFVENDSILPYYSWNEQDTFLINRKSVTNFMLTNYPSSFDLSLNVRNTFFFNSTITKNIMAGSNSVKIYPNETLILNTAYDIELEMVFSKFEYVYVNGKKYEYYRRFIRTYPAKLID